ncbi:hypothetical protein [Stieleria varia]|nr:hypothetical protein [Stieleria varia]
MDRYVDITLRRDAVRSSGLPSRKRRRPLGVKRSYYRQLQLSNQLFDMKRIVAAYDREAVSDGSRR